MMSKLLKQEEIEALMDSQNDEPVKPEEENEAVLAEQPKENIAGDEVAAEQPHDNTSVDGIAAEQTIPPDAAAAGEQPDVIKGSLSEAEMDALGEVGNICMGSAATTLSMLLNQKVNITSPRLTISSMEELFDSFVAPHITIFVRFIEGLSGFNILIMKVRDASVLADLMMGGDGSNVSDEINEISISAASEAMNQMIGSASTSMATMFGRTVNISPPETKVYYSADESELPEFGVEGPVVVVWFKMTIGDILDTQIMQVMGFDTAREEAGLILSELIPDKEKHQPEAAEAEDLSGMLDEIAGKDIPGETKSVEQVKHHESPVGSAPSFTHAAVRQGPLKAEPAASGFDQQRLDLILDIPLKVTVLLGRTRWPIKDILGLAPGSVVELQSLVDEPVEVLVNGTLVATGEVVVVNENFGVRISNIIGPTERLQNLRS